MMTTTPNLTKQVTNRNRTSASSNYSSNLCFLAAENEHKLEKLAATIAGEVKQRLIFPVILYFVNIALFLSSGLFAWRSWKQLIDGASTGMKPFENEDERPSPIE